MVRTILEVMAGLAGLLVVLLTARSVVKTLVLPRESTSRLAAFVGRKLTRGAFLAVARRLKTYEAKDKALAGAPPTALLAVLLAWLILFVFGYGLILWALQDVSLAEALRQSGSSTLTLGFATSAVAQGTVVEFAAATTGLVTVALQIAYLPVIYQAFNRRETLVTMLQSRAGAPAWGPEILARHQLVGIVDNLRRFYDDWERWAADVAESHATHPVLIWFRSPHHLRSWVVGLMAVLDSAALHHSLCPSTSPSEARLCIRMGFTCFRDLADAMGIAYDPDPFPDDPIDLTFEEFRGGVDRLAGVGFPMEVTPEEAWLQFRGWRVNYERIAYRLADIVVATPAPWSGERSFLEGITIAPQRPADRRPEDPSDSGRPKGYRGF